MDNDYDLDRGLTALTRPDSSTIEFDYDATSGRLETVTIPRGTVDYTYRSAGESGSGQVETIGSPDGVTLHYDYDGPLVLSERTSGYLADTLVTSYDHDLRPDSQTLNGHTIALRYNLDGLLAGAGIDSLYRSGATGFVDSTALAGLSATSSQDWNEYGELQNLHYTWTGGAFTQSMTRDALGRIATLTETIGSDTARTYAYVYTTAGRLRQVTRGSNVLEHYEYDANGNRTFAARWLASGLDTASATYDGQDRMTRYRNAAYAYTANGELSRRISGTDTTRYTYDPLGNLLQVRLPDGTTIDYKVDGRNRRVAKLVNGVFKRGWIYQDQLRVAGELDSTGALAIRYVYGSRANTPDYLVRYGTTYRVVPDQLGSVRLVVDASTGAIAESLGYDAWGRIVTQAAPGFVGLAYGAGMYDPHTGLVRFGARDLDPTAGRWASQDPIGFLGGPNLYCYVYGDPVNHSDPTGQRTYTQDETQRILDKARMDAGGLAGPLRAIRNHAIPGSLDTKAHEEEADYYQVGSRCMKADEFGNFLAGYAGYHAVWGSGIIGVFAGGWWFDLISDSVEGRPFNHDEDSRPDIEAGYEYAAYERTMRRSAHVQ